MTVLKDKGASAQRTNMMKQSQAGDQEAYSRLLTEICPLLNRYLVRRCRDREDTEDLVQQVLMRIHLYRRTFTGESSFDSWAFSVAANCLKDYYKSRPANWDSLDLVEESAAGPSTLESHVELQSALNQLSPEARRAVTLTKVDGLSAEEAAEVENVSSTALKVRAHRAMKALRRQFWVEE